jgi:type IV secretion system protein VirD4
MNGSPARTRGAALTPWEIAAALLIGAVCALTSIVWLWGGVAGLLFGDGWPQVSLAEVAQVVPRLPRRLGDPAAAWPASSRHGLPGAFGFFMALVVLLLVGAAVVAAGVRTTRRVRGGAGPLGGSRRPRAAAWATGRELRPLLVRAPVAGRLTLGRIGGRLAAAEPRQSVIVVAPTQSHKTTGLAVPAVLEWEGPVVAASVKSDLLRETLARRRGTGDVLVYDPTGSTGVPTSGWTPLAGCGTWGGAQRNAAWLTSSAQTTRGALADADFWYAAAAKLLAPLLFAAAISERTMADVVRWIDMQEEREVQGALEGAGVEAATIAAEASWRRDERQRSSIYTTAETALAAYADPGVIASADTSEITPERLLDGGAHTLYVCAPSHEQQRLRPLFATLTQTIVTAVFERAARTGRPLDPPLLLVLDEAANIAPLRELDTLASTAAGQGIQLVSVFQDLAQVRERWGTRAGSIVNNHRARIIGAGIADPDTLDYVARLLGDAEIRQRSSTTGADGQGSTTESSGFRALAPANVLREGRPGRAVLVYGHLPPAELELRPWFADRALRRLAAADTGAERGRGGPVVA